jgi:hypothetical protein
MKTLCYPSVTVLSLRNPADVSYLTNLKERVLFMLGRTPPLLYVVSRRVIRKLVLGSCVVLCTPIDCVPLCPDSDCSLLTLELHEFYFITN